MADFQISISVPLMFVVLGDLETCLELENAGYTTEENVSLKAENINLVSNLNEQLSDLACFP